MRFRYCLYSDIHGQVPQMEAVEKAVARENPDKVIVAGDLVGLGPEPDKIVQHFMGRPDIDVIVGNVDLWVANKVDEKTPPKSPHQEWMFRMTRMTRERMTEEQLEWLRKRPFSMTYTPELGHDFRVFHGTPYDIGDKDAFPARLTEAQIAEKLQGQDFDVGAHGHIHGPSVRYIKTPNKTRERGSTIRARGDQRPWIFSFLLSPMSVMVMPNRTRIPPSMLGK